VATPDPQPKRVEITVSTRCVELAYAGASSGVDEGG